MKRLEDCPLQQNENAPEATLIIYPEYKEGIKDISVGSGLLLLTWLNLADRSVLKCVRRNYFNTPMVGVFTTRSPDRPNPIGIHEVKVVAISEDGAITVSELEVLDETPLIDIKPL